MKLKLLLILIASNFFWITGVSGQTAQVINPTGGVGLNDGLKIQVNTNGALAVYRDNQSQYYSGHTWPSGNQGGVQLSFLFDNGSIFNATSRSLSACSTTPVEQVGNTFTTTISGYVQSSIQDNGIYPTFFLTLDVTYTHPNNYFLVDYFVRAPEGLTAPQTLHLYLGHDAYILGKDGSRAYRVVNGTGEFVGDFRNSNDAGQCSGSAKNDRYPSTHGFKTKNGFRSYYSGSLSTYNQVNATLMLQNVIGVETACPDDGVAVEFAIGPLSAGETKAKQVLHGYGNTKGEFNNTVVNDPVVSAAPSTPVTINMTAATFTESEGNASHLANQIKIQVSGGVLAREQVCNFTLANGTALQNTDYTYVKGFTIPAGNYTTPQEFTLNNITIQGNTICQSDRAFTVSIDPPGQCNDLLLRGTTSSAVVTIQDDEIKPEVANVFTNQTYHYAEPVPAVTLVSSPAGATINWTNTNSSIGLPASGTATIPAFTANNTTASSMVATLTVKAIKDCEGAAKTFTITVLPKPTLVYHYASGVAPSIANPTSYVYGPAVSIVNNPTRTGYTFAGWTCAELGVTTPIKPFVIPANTDMNLNLHANWGVDAYTITYQLGGGTVTPPDPNPTIYDVNTPTFTLKNPVRPGFTFTGWTGTGLSSATTTATVTTGSTGHRTYTATWTENNYTITYNYAAGNAPVTPNKGNYRITEVPFSINTTVVANQPTRTGYRFDGWTGHNLSTSNQTIEVTLGSFSTHGMPENLLYTANWSTILYNVTYNLNAGTLATPNLTGYDITTPSFTLNNPTRPGYTFGGWSGTGVVGSSSSVTVPTGSIGDRSYTASWVPINYLVTYVDDNGTTPLVAPGAPTQYNDTQLPLAFSSTPVKAGWTFIGWTGTGALAGPSISIPAGTLGALTYQAEWTAKAYTIMFNANGGTNPSYPNNWNGYNVTELPLNNLSVTPTYPGYTFKGWNGHGLSDEENPFHITSAMAGVPGNLLFTAAWSLNNYAITYDANGGVLTPGNRPSYDVTQLPFSITQEPTHLNASKKFIGWTCTQLNLPQQLVYTVPAGTWMPLDFRAHWSKSPEELNPGAYNDTLFVCEAPKKLFGDPDALAVEWVLPDGSQVAQRDLEVDKPGRYVTRSNYGVRTISDTLYVFFFANEKTKVSPVSTRNQKTGVPIQFTVNLSPEVMRHTTAHWSAGDGVILQAGTDSLTAVWSTTGQKTVTLRLSFNYAGTICSKTYTCQVSLGALSAGLFVNQHAAGAKQDGTSWQDAYHTLEEALAKAASGDYIWVAQGTYTPSNAGSSFVIDQDSIAIFGGFEGTEKYLYERNPNHYPTILQGNKASVVSIQTTGIHFDGFVIQGGEATDGGGIYFTSGTSSNIENCIIKNNKATQRGGGVFADIPWYSYEQLRFVNTVISGNRADWGGAMYNVGDEFLMLNVTVSGNIANQVGGIYNAATGNPHLRNTIVWGNYATKGTKETHNIVNDGGKPLYAYNILGGSNGSGASWNASFGNDGGHNLDVDPLFNRTGFENDGVTLRDGNYRVSVHSQAVNKGDNQYVTEGDISTPWEIYLSSPEKSFVTGLLTDVAYMDRIGEDRVDMGAYENNSHSAGINPIIRDVILPKINDVITDPGEGVHHVRSKSDFVFTLYLGSSYQGKMPKISTSRGEKADREGVIVKRNDNGSYQVTIRQVQESLEIFMGFTVGNETVSSTRVWVNQSKLHVRLFESASVVTVYTLSGQVYQQLHLTAGETVVPMEKGVYLVTFDNGTSQKVVVQ